jgi:hypothetical protein
MPTPFAERLRPVFVKLTTLSANSTAEELNRRGIATARDGRWSVGSVINLRKRLEQ